MRHEERGPSDFDVERHLTGIIDRLGDEGHAIARAAGLPEARRTGGIWAGGSRPAPAVVAAMLGVAAILVVALGVGVKRAAPHPARTYATRAGQRESITLSDGTQLTLAPASRLDVPTDYTRGDRAVRLEGEAFFAVVHNAVHPFAVKTATATVTDIGTQFNIRAYAGDAVTHVAVAEGIVAVGRQSLRAGEVATVTDTTIVLTRSPAALEDALAWNRGCLTFRNATLRDVATALGRWYDVDVLIPDAAIAERRLSANMCNQPLPDALGAVALPLGLRYEQAGSHITFRSSTPA